MTTPPEGPGRARQSLIYRAGVLGHRPTVPTDFGELERRAMTAMSPRAWAYVAGGAGEGATMRANRAAFDRWRDRAAHAARRHVERDLSDRAARTPAADARAARTRRCSRRWSTATATCEIAGRPRPSWACPTSSPTRAAHPMEDVRRGDGRRRRGGSSSTGPPTSRSSTACIARAEAIGAEATRGHARHDDARLASPGPEPRVAAVLPGHRHRAVHVGPPVPRDRRRAGGRQRAGSATAPRATSRSPSARCGRCCRSAASIPGDLLRQPALPHAPRRRRDLPRHLLEPGPDLGAARDPARAHRACRSCSRGSCTLTTRAGPCEVGATGSWSATTADARSTARSRPWTPCRRCVRPSGRTCRCSWTAASGPAPTSSRRSPWAPTPSPSAGRTSTAWPWPGGDGVRDVLANIVAELDLTMGLSGVGSVAQIGPELLTTAP